MARVACPNNQSLHNSVERRERRMLPWANPQVYRLKIKIVDHCRFFPKLTPLLTQSLRYGPDGAREARPEEQQSQLSTLAFASKLFVRVSVLCVC